MLPRPTTAILHEFGSSVFCSAKNRCAHIFSVLSPVYLKLFLDVIRDVYAKSSFPHPTRPWNFLPVEYFTLTYDVNGYKSVVNRHFLSLGSF